MSDAGRIPSSPLNFFHSFQRPPACRFDGDWVHAAADAARTLGVADDVRCRHDILLPDFRPLPPQTNLINTKEYTYPRPKTLLSSLLRQEALAYRLPDHASAFQAELVAILHAL